MMVLLVQSKATQSMQCIKSADDGFHLSIFNFHDVYVPSYAMYLHKY